MPRIDQIKSMLEDEPNDAFLLFALAKEYESADQIDKAISTYIVLREHHRTYVGLYYHLAHLYHLRANHTSALDIYDEGIQIAQNLGDHHALSELKNAKMNLEIEL